MSKETVFARDAALREMNAKKVLSASFIKYNIEVCRFHPTVYIKRKTWHSSSIKSVQSINQWCLILKLWPMICLTVSTQSLKDGVFRFCSSVYIVPTHFPHHLYLLNDRQINTLFPIFCPMLLDQVPNIQSFIPPFFSLKIPVQQCRSNQSFLPSFFSFIFKHNSKPSKSSAMCLLYTG